MRESILQGRIRVHLINEGWFVVKLINTSKPGMPDLMAIKDGKTFFLEVKTDKGRVSKLQEHHIEGLNAMGVPAYVVRSVSEVKDILSQL